MKLSPKDIIFLLVYPLAHMAAIVLCFVVSDKLGADSMLAEVLFMAVLLLIAPVLAFPRTLEELNLLFADWMPAAVFLLVYAVILVVYALPIWFLFRNFRKGRP